MPPAPFLFRTLSTDMVLIFTNYGGDISVDDAKGPIIAGLTR